MSGVVRCAWAENGDAAMQDYHDTEWGVPHRDDTALFELLTLEGAQAGLSWRTILKRREGYRASYHSFDIARVAGMTDKGLENLLAGAPIIRNRLKVYSVRDNARAALEVIRTEGSLSSFLWSFVNGTPVINRWTSPSDVPAETEESKRMSRELRRRGFRFVGSTICYAFMQATGMVNDHLVTCFRHANQG